MFLPHPVARAAAFRKRRRTLERHADATAPGRCAAACGVAVPAILRTPYRVYETTGFTPLGPSFAGDVTRCVRERVSSARPEKMQMPDRPTGPHAQARWYA